MRYLVRDSFPSKYSDKFAIVILLSLQLVHFEIKSSIHFNSTKNESCQWTFMFVSFKCECIIYWINCCMSRFFAFICEFFFPFTCEFFSSSSAFRNKISIFWKVKIGSNEKRNYIWVNQRRAPFIFAILHAEAFYHYCYRYSETNCWSFSAQRL